MWRGRIGVMADPTIVPTSARTLVTYGVSGLILMGVACLALRGNGDALPVLGMASWLPLLIFAAILGAMLVVILRARSAKRPLPPTTAVMMLRMAQASSRVAVLAMGAYLAIVLFAIPGWPAPLAQGRVGHGCGAIVAGAVWMTIALVIERLLKITDGDGEESAAKS